VIHFTKRANLLPIKNNNLVKDRNPIVIHINFESITAKKDSPGINMALRTLFVLMNISLISINTWAEEIQINPTHPDQYTVVKGDTLWDISGKFLNQPWQWPELWNNNAQIKNPQLIYPGDTIYFSIVNGRPQLDLSRNAQQAQYGDGGRYCFRNREIITLHSGNGY
jgi:hypothetical protein